NAFDEIGTTPLYRACNDGNVKVTKILLKDERTNPNLGNSNIYGSAPIHGCCVRGHESTLKLLLRRSNIDLNLIDKRGASPLDAAVYYHQVYGKDHTNIIRLLKERGAKFRMYGDTPGFEPTLADFIQFWLGNMGSVITEACDHCYVRLITELFQNKDKYKIDPTARNRLLKRMSGIEAAANKGCTPIVKILLENGFDPNEQKNELKKSALQLAQDGGFQECASVIQEWIDKQQKK
ncbi:ankyrin repeat protein, partial [Reticulomyxa filosa]